MRGTFTDYTIVFNKVYDIRSVNFQMRTGSGQFKIRTDEQTAPANSLLSPPLSFIYIKQPPMLSNKL